MKIYPNAGQQLRDPVTRQLVPVEGIEVDDHSPDHAWLLANGDASLEPPLVFGLSDIAEPSPEFDAIAAANSALLEPRTLADGETLAEGDIPAGSGIVSAEPIPAPEPAKKKGE